MKRIRIELPLEGIFLRSFEGSDVEALVRHADNPRVAAHLRDRFPSPYTPADARRWIQLCRSQDPEQCLVIAESTGLIGAIGLELQEDVHARSAEMGYWLAEPRWGRGIATAAVREFLPYAFDTFGLIRVYATVFSANPASARVLEKAGLEFEGRLRHSVVKEGHILDQLMYAAVRDHIPEARP